LLLLEDDGEYLAKVKALKIDKHRFRGSLERPFGLIPTDLAEVSTKFVN
jgi:hypothetical protein